MEKKSMRNRKTFSFIFLIFLCTVKMYSQVGFSFESSIFIPEENEYFSDFVYSKKSSLSYKIDSLFSNTTFCMIPEVYYDYSTYPKFIFQYFDFSVFLSNFSVQLKKNKFDSNIGNIYKTEIPYNIVEKDVSYWNFNVIFLAGYFKFVLQSILDSENPDRYKAPNWENAIFKIKFDSERIESSLLNNFFYDWNKNKFVYKVNLSANYILNENFNFYVDAGSCFEDECFFTVLSGIQYSVLLNDFVPSIAAEYANIKDENIIGLFVNLNYADFINLYFGAKKNCNIENHLGFFSEIKMSFKEFVFNLLFEWEDVFARKKYVKIGVSLNEK